MMKSLSFLALSVALAGCSVLPSPSPPDVTYRMASDWDVVAPKTNASVVRVDRASGVSTFNTRSIIVSPDGRRLSQVAQAQWPELIPIMVQESLVEAMSSSENLIGILPSSGARTDTRVHLNIKNYEAQFDRGEDSAPLAVVRFTATLANASDRSLIGTFNTRQDVRAASNRVPDIVRAMEQANDAAMSEIVAWLEEEAAQGDI